MTIWEGTIIKLFFVQTTVQHTDIYTFSQVIYLLYKMLFPKSLPTNIMQLKNGCNLAIFYNAEKLFSIHNYHKDISKVVIKNKQKNACLVTRQHSFISSLILFWGLVSRGLAINCSICSINIRIRFKAKNNSYFFGKLTPN